MRSQVLLFIEEKYSFVMEIFHLGNPVASKNRCESSKMEKPKRKIPFDYG